MTTATATRRLAAIFAADVVGYSRLMGADEEGTHERFKAHLRELVDPKIREHHGRIVKTTGDGLLAEFASVVDAVRCAGEIQRAMADRDLDLAAERRLRFRIGVNLGDVIADGGDIYGDRVNIGARLEGLATPGGICVSGTVRDHIGDRLPYAFEDMGEQSVKNIARPVRVYAWRPEGMAGRPTASVSSTVSSSPPVAAPRLSIVVLPFTNLGDDREQQYFADGITEDLTTDLSRLENMFVISRNTAFTYRNKPIDTKQIGRELGGRYVLEGSIMRSGSQVRVSAQLIDAATDAPHDQMIVIGFGDALCRGNEPAGQIRLRRFEPGRAGRAAMLSSLAPQCVQLGESALVARAPGRDAVAQPILLHRDLTAKLMLLVGFLREDRVAPSLKCRETLTQDARNAAVEPYGAARESFEQPPIMADQNDEESVRPAVATYLPA